MNKWIVVALLCLANIIAYVDRTNLSVALASADFKTYFQLTDSQRGDLNSAFFWSYAFLQVPIGALADRYGVKYPLAISFLLWSLVSASTGWATSLWQLFAFRILLGVGEAIITPGSLRWIRFHVDEKQRGLALGFFFAGAKLGPGIGAFTAVWLLREYGWRLMFTILGLGSLVWLIPWLWIVKNDDRKLETEALAKSTEAAVSFGSVFKTPAIYGIIIGTFAYNYFNYFCMTWMPAYFVEHWKLNMNDMGIYTAFSFTGMAIVAILAGTAGDRLIARGWNPIKVRKGFTIAGLTIASTEVIGVMSGSRDVALAFAVISLAGLGLTTANYWALTQSLMPGAAIGRIAGVQNFASNLSGIVAPIVTGRLIAMTGSYEAPMQAILVILASGIAAYVFLVRPKYAPKAEKAAA
ncbi:MAG TPA: MFS transporter [Bryobacteraceae bacterium]|nr:MFS transporter [Bryobacteraceae bacterium]